jgi:DNA-binding NtrC family response regulator
MSFDAKTVLVVDDEPDVLACIAEILTPLGCRTILAQSGEEALEITGELEEKIDLLITDIVLPAMKGKELAKRFAKKYPDTKILFMSGYLSPAISPEDQLNRTKAFIQKPFLFKEFVKASARLLEEL